MVNNITTFESIKNNKGGMITIEKGIDSILDDLGSNSENTKTSYKKAFNDFIKNVFDKDINTIQWTDLENLTYDMIVNFRSNLRAQREVRDRRKLKYHPRTINQKMFALSSMFKKLSRINERIEPSIFELTPLKFDDTEGSYGSLTEDEVDRLLNYCLELPNYQKPLEKSLFFETAYVTAIRSGALMKLTWGDIKKRKDILQDVEYNIIKTQDKGEIVEVPIDDNLYGRIMVMKEGKIKRGYTVTELKTERVFPVTRKTLSKCLKDFCEIEGIDEDRNIVLHSLKKASIDTVYKESGGNLNVTARHGHHKSIEMVYRHYEGKNNGLANSPSLKYFNNAKKDLGELNNLSKEELLKVIENCNSLTVEALLESHKEIYNKKK